MKPLALVLENDRGTRSLLGVLLGRFGLAADLVETGSDALLLFEHVEYDVLFIDLLLPGTNGMDVLRWLAEHRPAMLDRCVVLSGASPAALNSVAENWPQVRVIRKPFEITEIVAETERTLARPTVRTGSAAEEFTRRSVAIGAKAGIVLRANGTSGSLEPVFSFGYKPEDLEPFLPMTFDKPYPLCVAFRSAQPVWLASVTSEESEYPLLVPVWRKNASRALAALPLIARGEPVGAAGWSFAQPRTFAETEREELLAIAQSAADDLPPTARSGAAS